MMRAIPVSSGTASSAGDVGKVASEAAVPGGFAQVLSARAGEGRAGGAGSAGDATEAGSAKERPGRREGQAKGQVGDHAPVLSGVGVAVVTPMVPPVAGATSQTAAQAATDGGALAAGMSPLETQTGVVGTAGLVQSGDVVEAGEKPDNEIAERLEPKAAKMIAGRGNDASGSFLTAFQGSAAVNGPVGMGPVPGTSEVMSALVAGVAGAVSVGSRPEGALSAVGGTEPRAASAGEDGAGRTGGSDAANGTHREMGRLVEGLGERIPVISKQSAGGAGADAAGSGRPGSGRAGTGDIYGKETAVSKPKASTADRTDQSADGTAGDGGAATTVVPVPDGGAPGPMMTTAAAMSSAVLPTVLDVGARAQTERSSTGPSESMAPTAGMTGGEATKGVGAAGGALSDVAVSRLLHTAAGTELRVGTRLGELGAVQIRTVLGREQVQAHIAVENEHLGSVLTAHLGGLEDALGGRTGQAVRATVSVGMEMNLGGGQSGARQHSGEAGMTGAGGGAGARSRDGGERGAHGGAERGRSVGRAVSEVTAAMRYGTGAGGGGGHGGSRLDVRV